MVYLTAKLREHCTDLWQFLNDLAASDPKAYQEFLASQHKAYMESSEETDAKRKDGQVQAIKHKMNQRALEEAMETAFVKPRKEVEDKIYFEPIAVFVLKTKVKTAKPLQNINTNTNIKNAQNNNDLTFEKKRVTMSDGDKLFINFLKSPYVKSLYFKDKITEPVNVQSVLHSPNLVQNISVPFQSSVLLAEKDHCTYTTYINMFVFIFVYVYVCALLLFLNK
ncbi:hypothetical protein RFI_31618 [Reticulomyxa filosa]|uniref:Uncharacterized protein n=1 Tax=Reticulomyxa filosa TaxID=46433 RepID=X6LV23_RETFI|nr:hypothetical protein RFI_31618 [Reticulomyxa filosa]|eukprot:ETO05778.1 hypothetical protein RFI_31618 [Reticulomyxa filosa]